MINAVPKKADKKYHDQKYKRFGNEIKIADYDLRCILSKKQ